MRQELIEKFKDFEKELDRLKTANSHIETSKVIAEKSMDLLDKSSTQLLKQLDKVINQIEKSYFDQTAEYKTEFQIFKQSYDGYKDEIKSAIKDMFDSLDKPVKLFDALTKDTKALIQKIDTINFPERLDKLEHSVNTTFSDILQFNREVNKQAQELIHEIKNVNFEHFFNGLKGSIASTLSNITTLNHNLETEIKKQSEIQNAFTENLVRNIEDIDIPVKFKNLNETISRSVNEIKSANTQTQERTEALTKAIEAINISQRLDKLDATIAGITQSIQTVLQRLETLERNIKDGQVNKSGEIINQIKSIDTITRDLVNQLQINTNALIKNELDKIKLVLAEKYLKQDKANQVNRILSIASILLILSLFLFVILK